MTALQEDPVLQAAHQDTHEIEKNAKLHMVLPIHYKVSLGIEWL